jgi:anthranilate phosphoribosyltransferase
MVERIAQVVALIGTRRSLVVHGNDGLDEISISAPTTAFLVEQGDLRQMDIAPEDFGLERAPREAVQGGTVDENLRLARSVLAGELLDSGEVRTRLEQVRQVSSELRREQVAAGAS